MAVPIHQRVEQLEQKVGSLSGGLTSKQELRLLQVETQQVKLTTLLYRTLTVMDDLSQEVGALAARNGDHDSVRRLVNINNELAEALAELCGGGGA